MKTSEQPSIETSGEVKVIVKTPGRCAPLILSVAGAAVLGLWGVIAWQKGIVRIDTDRFFALFHSWNQPYIISSDVSGDPAKSDPADQAIPDHRGANLRQKYFRTPDTSVDPFSSDESGERYSSEPKIEQWEDKKVKPDKKAEARGLLKKYGHLLEESAEEVPLTEDESQELQDTELENLEDFSIPPVLEEPPQDQPFYFFQLPEELGSPENDTPEESEEYYYPDGKDLI